MRVLLDACVLFPSVLREVLIGAADLGAFRPLWSARILDEWLHAAARLGREAEGIAQTEITLLRARFPQAEMQPAPLDDITLPDADDVHVLGAAVAGRANYLATKNLRDFPTRVVGRFGIQVTDPDVLLLSLLAEGHAIYHVVSAVRARTEAISGRPQLLRPLLRRAGLPRLGKQLG
ncbi:MAG: PIN domain-containing protein [Paracoccaceae bacterium]